MSPFVTNTKRQTDQGIFLFPPRSSHIRQHRQTDEKKKDQKQRCAPGDPHMGHVLAHRGHEDTINSL